MHHQGILPIAFPALAVIVVLWFFLITRLFDRLASRHRRAYDAMGRPSLGRLLQGSVEAGKQFLFFVFLRRHRSLGDARLSMLADSLLVLFVIYMGSLVGLSMMVMQARAAA